MQYYQNQFHLFLFTFLLQLSEHLRHRVCIILLLASAAVGDIPTCVLSYTWVSLREGACYVFAPAHRPPGFLPFSSYQFVSELEGGEAWLLHSDPSFLEGEIVGRASVLQGDISKRQFGGSSQILTMAGDTTRVYFASDSGLCGGTQSLATLRFRLVLKTNMPTVGTRGHLVSLQNPVRLDPFNRWTR